MTKKWEELDENQSAKALIDSLTKFDEEEELSEADTKETITDISVARDTKIRKISDK